MILLGVNNMLIKDGTMTQQMNEVLYEQMQETDKLLNDDVLKLIKGIKPIKPEFYYNRLIKKLFPQSDYAKTIGDNCDTTDVKIMKMRNKLIREAIRDNVSENSIKLNPKYTCKDVEDLLTRKDRSNFNRNKIFVISLALNLTYEQMLYLLVHCCGEREINFKDPYEVILAYCIKGHTNVCEHYNNLIQKYESSVENDVTDREDNADTSSLAQKFENVDTDEKLLSFLVSLPLNTKSMTATIEFKYIYDEIVKIIGDNNQTYLRDDLKTEIEEQGLFWNFDEIDFKYRKKLENAKLVSVESFIKELYQDDNFKKNAKKTFSYLRKQLPTSQDLTEILNSKKEVTKENIILLLFYRYCLSGEWADFIDDLDENKPLLKSVYDDFKLQCNFELSACDFSDLYLPNAFERFIVFCICSTNPIETFKKVISL